MKVKSSILTASLLAASLTLAACSDGGNAHKNMNMSGDKNAQEKKDDNSMNHDGMKGMKHNMGGQVPDGLKKAQNPKYKEGSQAMITEGHMPGMKGAMATIAGAYHTTVYSVTYTPTTGGKPVKNHKWVIQEELKDAKKPLKAGDKATLNADHMKGMKGAEAVIDTAKETDVYTVNYKPTTGGPMVKNHQWVTEDELMKMK